MHELPNELMSDLIQDLRKLGNLKEISEKLGIQPSQPPKSQILTVALENCEKSAEKHSKETLLLYLIL